MGSMFGGGSDSTDQMLQMQKDEAAEARQKAAERAERITAGTAKIKEMFSKGVEGKAKKTFDWKTFNPKTAKAGAVPGMSGYSFVDLPAISAVAGRAATPGTRRELQSGGRDGGGVGTRYGPVTGGSAAVAAVPGRAAGMYIKGPDGKIYKQGDVVSGTVGTGKWSGGPNTPDFFNKFRDSITKYYLPQVADQLGEAERKTKYGLANAGLGASSAAIDKFADLAKQNTANIVSVNKKADDQTGALRTRVANEQNNAIEQLKASENPSVDINTVLGNIRNISPEATDLTPLAALFDIATLGAGNYAAGARNAERLRGVPGAAPGGRIVG